MSEKLDDGLLWHCLWSTKDRTDMGRSDHRGIPSKRRVSEIARGAGKVKSKSGHVEVIMRDRNAEDAISCSDINRYGDFGATLGCDSSAECEDD